MRGWGGRPELRRYDVASALWRAPALRLAVLSDLHVCAPWSPLSALAEVVARVNAEAPDLVLLPGDFLVRGPALGRAEPAARIAAVLAGLVAPLGRFATLGNHDWKDCPEARVNGHSATSVAPALEAWGIPVLSNRAVPLDGGRIWLAGLDSQQGIGRARRPDPRHDPEAAFADIPDGASTLLMAHEPDIFLDRTLPAALQLSGHTHAGQITLAGWRPVVPSRHGGRLAHGLHSRGERHLIVSAGLGYSGLPVRVGAPPEIVIATLRPGRSAPA